MEVEEAREEVCVKPGGLSPLLAAIYKTLIRPYLDQDSIFILFVKSIFSYQRPIFEKVVMDFSLAEMHALSSDFNNVSLANYCDECFLVATGIQQKINPKWTPLCLCYSHLLNMFSKRVEHYYGKDKTFKFIIEVLESVYSMSDFKIISNLYELLAELVLTKFYTPRADYLVKTLANIVIGTEVAAGDEIINTVAQIFEISDDESDEIVDPTQKTPNDRICIDAPSEKDEYLQYDINKPYTNNKFYYYFDSISDSLVIDNEGSGSTLNQFYNPLFLRFITKRYFSVVCMWSLLIVKKRGCNAPVENYFNTVKNNLVGKNRRLKLSRFMRRTREYVLYHASLMKMKIFDRRIKTHTKRAKVQNGKPSTSDVPVSKSKKRKGDEDQEVYEETWQKKRRLTAFYKRHVHSKKINKEAHKYIDSHENKRIGSYEFYNNRLVKTPQNYYLKKVCVNERATMYAVAIFKENNLLMMNTLVSEDFHTLSITEYDGREKHTTDMWLSSPVIDRILNIFYNIGSETTKDEFMIICSERVPHLFVRGSPGDPVGEYMRDIVDTLKEGKKILVLPVHSQPFNKSMHWSLVTIDLKRNVITHYDSLRNEDLSLDIYNRFAEAYRFLTGYHGILGLTVNKVNIPQQKDSYNCGVYLCYFAYCILNSQEIKSDFHADRYRNELMRLILENSDDVRNFCLKCGSNKDGDSVMWTKCAICSRWLHNRCIKTVQPHFSENAAELYYCFLCSSSATN